VIARALAWLAVVGAAVAAVQPSAARRLVFDNGKTVVVVRTSIESSRTVRYLVDGNAGDHFIVRFERRSGHCLRTTVTPPSGLDATMQPGGGAYDAMLNESGTYSIEVTNHVDVNTGCQAVSRTIRMRVELVHPSGSR
jgi:hypothetical protein